MILTPVNFQRVVEQCLTEKVNLINMELFWFIQIKMTLMS